MRIPPVLFGGSQGSALDQATQDLIGALTPLGQFIASLPDSPEARAAAVKFNEAVLWAHQALARSMGQGVIALPDDLTARLNRVQDILGARDS